MFVVNLKMSFKVIVEPEKIHYKRQWLGQALFPRTSASSAKLHWGWGAARSTAPQPSDQPYQADSDGSGHDMVWLDLSARY